MATAQPAACGQVSTQPDDKIDEILLDLVKRGGSFSSETISSRNGRQTKAMSSLKRRLRDQQASFEDGGSPGGAPCAKGDEKLRQDIQVDQKRERKNTCFHHYRFFVASFAGMSVGLMMFLRYNISISVLKMVNQTHLYLEEHPGNTVEDMIADGHIPGGEFNWNNEIQQLIMASYMIAYTLPQLPMAKVGIILGARYTTSIALAVCSLANILTPMFSYFGWEYVIILRLVNGFGASPILPMLIHLLETWFRQEEISLGLGVSQAVTTIINAMNPLVSGYLSSIHWSLSFYVPGAMVLVFCVIWALMISTRPQDNFLVSQKELDYIQAGQIKFMEQSALKSDKQTATTAQNNNNSNNEVGQQKKLDSDIENKAGNPVADGEDNDDQSYPWHTVLRAPSFYAYLLLWCLHCGTFNAFNFILPTYLIQFLRIKVAQNGLYCTLIMLGCVVAVCWPHPTLQMLQKRFGLSDGAARRVVLTVCCVSVAVTWIFVGMSHQFQLIFFFLNRCTQNGVDVIITSTLMLNYARVGLSSLAFGAMNTIGCLSVVFSSTLVGWFLDYTGQSETGWCIIFVSMGMVQAVIWALFVLFIPVAPLEFKHPPPKFDPPLREL